MAKPSEKPLFTYGPAEWAAEPGTAFDAFLSSYRFNNRGLRASSFEVYRGMFSRLRTWASGHGVELFDLNGAHIEDFLQGRGLSDETRHRYLLLFTTLFTHLALLRSDVEELANPARELLLEREAPGREEPEHLGTVELRRFLDAIPPGEQWKRVRDRALLYAILGAGLRSTESLTLRLDAFHRKAEFLDSVWVPAHKPSPARQVPLHSFAAPALEQWLGLRATLGSATEGKAAGTSGLDSLGIPGDLVFPANLAGAPLTPVTLFRLVKNTLQRAGIVKRYEGPTLLRNTAGALWLKKHEPLQVALWMGHATARTTELLLPPDKRSKPG